MAMLTVRNIPDEVHRALRVRAARQGHSMEAEVRDILASTVSPQGRVKLGSLLGLSWTIPAAKAGEDHSKDALGMGIFIGIAVEIAFLVFNGAAGFEALAVIVAMLGGVLTEHFGLLPSVQYKPYIGFGMGTLLALSMAILDWHGIGTVLGVAAVMGFVQILDGMIITPRIVGRSVGLAPLEVLVTMMAAGSLFGFLGVLLAVPLGAVVKILVQRGVRAYIASTFYRFRPEKGQIP